MTPARPLALLLALCLATPVGAQDVTRPELGLSSAAASASSKDDLPAGAPRDDYEFVGWCAGALTGHMELFTRVEPTLKEISKRWNTEERDAKEYAEQQIVGRDFLVQFAAAMRAAENASTQALAPRGQRAITMGRDRWAAINSVDDNAKAYSWMNWGLPQRCERVAAQLKSRATLMGAMLRDNSKNAVQTSAVRVVAPRPDEKPVATPATDATASAQKPAVVAPAQTAPAATVVAALPKPSASEAASATAALNKSAAAKAGAAAPTVAPKTTTPAKPATVTPAKPTAAAAKPATQSAATPAKAAGLR